ncbi:Hypothetical predicted protein [Mytilus galloprovincialis]|nr:Hypothetical predicted protein [Mytilus galloprovincialis]
MDAREKLNTAKLDEINNIKKQTETFVQSVKDSQIQDQTRFNKSYQEVVEYFKIKATNETDIYGDQINTLLESFSSKIEVFTEAEKKRESVIELMQLHLDREQKRFNFSSGQKQTCPQVWSGADLSTGLVKSRLVHRSGLEQTRR